MVTKKSQTKSKASAKKNVVGKTTKPAKKTGVKKTLRDVKRPGTKLSASKTAAKPAVRRTPGPEIKKPIKAVEVIKTKKGAIAAKKPVKSVAVAKGGKALSKKPLKTISVRKSETPGKKPLKKSPVKIVNAKTRITQQKTIKPNSTKKPSAQKVSKVVVGKSEVKTAKTMKTPAKTVKAALKEKRSTVKTTEPKITPQKTIAPLSTKKLSAQKVGKIVAVKTTGKTAKEIKAPAKTVSAAKKEKKSSVKILKKKGTSSLITTEPLPATTKKVPTHPLPSDSETKSEKAANLKIFLPDEELPPAEAQREPSAQLPEEYGENELLLMEVDPSIVFVSWEIKPDDISGKAGKLTLRVYDVTGTDFDGANAIRYFDIPVRKRVDSKFIDIKMSGRDVIMEVGLLDSKGTFRAIKRSNRVSMPALQTFEELGITRLSDRDALIGY